MEMLLVFGAFLVGAWAGGRYSRAGDQRALRNQADYIDQLERRLGAAVPGDIPADDKGPLG